MSNAKHTPTPWKVNRAQGNFHKAKFNIRPEQAGYSLPADSRVAVVDGGTESENQANAAFIVRACNGFPAWDDVADWVSDHKNGLGPDISRLELALKNGRGE